MDTVAVLGRQYRPRVIDSALRRGLDAAGAVLLEGARASGKTMTAMNAAQSYVFVDDPEVQTVLDVAPRSLLEGDAPRLLDEWQVAPALWNLVRRSVDAAPDPGQFILTGSAVPADDITRHTGAGRFLRLRQRTMAWCEKLDPAPDQVSIAGLFEGERPATNIGSGSELDATIDNILRPGFPAMTALDPEQSARRLRGYIDDVTRTDISRLAEVRHEPEVIKQLLVALARSVASEVTHRTLAADVRAVAPIINVETVAGYLQLLQRLFIVETQAPWTPQLRSRARMRTAPKYHLADASLAAAALGAGADQLRNDLGLLGLLFESAVIHDLAVLTSVIDGEIRHYRDSNGNEIDAVVILPDGRWAAVEVKLGAGHVSTGIRSLRKAVHQVDTEAIGEPAFCLVVTGTGPLLTAEDGVIVSPLSALAP
jgi:uncharacterized protein